MNKTIIGVVIALLAIVILALVFADRDEKPSYIPEGLEIQGSIN